MHTRGKISFLILEERYPVNLAKEPAKYNNIPNVVINVSVKDE
jgi:hypothetical protein